MHEVMILGGYGNFGKRIAAGLARHNIPVTIVGRNAAKAGAMVAEIRAQYKGVIVSAEIFDAELELDRKLAKLQPGIVINTCGPFQNKGYGIAELCIKNKTHYIDLADGRDFVTGISALDQAAQDAGICVISGASTVPALSSAVLDYYKKEFASIDTLIFGITPGQKAERGLATTRSILSYLGKPLKQAAGQRRPRYGWQDLYRQDYPNLGKRWMANCDIPDLDLLPPRYGLQSICFSAGMENPLLHFGVWALGWAVRLGLRVDLGAHAASLLRLSRWFDRFGSDAGGMHMMIGGKTPGGKNHLRRWFIIARNGDGPYIPCVPAIVLAKKLAQGVELPPGAQPCLGLVTLQEYLDELRRFSIKIFYG